MTFVEKFSVSESAPLTNQSELNTATAAVSSKLLGLELLRIGSAMAVLFYHYIHFSKVAGAAQITRASVPFYNWLWPLYDYGQFGVELFWGISGYIFFWKYGHAIHSGAVSARRFFWLRFSRLYPLHLATLILVASLQMVHRKTTGGDYIFPANQPVQFFEQLFLANDWWVRPSHSFNAPIWSVSAEVAVYAGFFLLLRKFAPSFKLCLTVVLVALALQLNGLSSVPLLCAFFFFVGGMAAILPPLGSHRRILSGFLAMLIFCVAARYGIMRDVALIPWVILGILPFLLAALAGNWPGLDRWQLEVGVAGNLTYSTYLLHFPLQLLLAIIVAWTGIRLPLTSSLFLLAYIGITLTAAAVCYRRFELPAQNWLRRAENRGVSISFASACAAEK